MQNTALGLREEKQGPAAPLDALGTNMPMRAGREAARTWRPVPAAGSGAGWTGCRGLPQAGSPRPCLRFAISPTTSAQAEPSLSHHLLPHPRLLCGRGHTPGDWAVFAGRAKRVPRGHGGTSGIHQVDKTAASRSPPCPSPTRHAGGRAHPHPHPRPLAETQAPGWGAARGPSSKGVEAQPRPFAQYPFLLLLWLSDCVPKASESF